MKIIDNVVVTKKKNNRKSKYFDVISNMTIVKKENGVIVGQAIQLTFNQTMAARVCARNNGFKIMARRHPEDETIFNVWRIS